MRPYLCFNIETIADPESPIDGVVSPDAVDAPSNYKDMEKILAYKDKEAKRLTEESRSKFSLSPLTGRIICLSTMTNEDESPRNIFSPASTEKEIVASFMEQSADLFLKGGIFVSYNGKSFDLPFLCVAAVRYGLHIPFSFAKYNSKYNSMDHVDVYTVLSNYEPKRGKLSEWSQRMGVSAVHGKGNMVHGWWNDANVVEIARHCMSNTLATAQLFTMLANSGMV